MSQAIQRTVDKNRHEEACLTSCQISNMLARFSHKIEEPNIIKDRAIFYLDPLDTPRLLVEIKEK